MLRLLGPKTLLYKAFGLFLMLRGTTMETVGHHKTKAAAISSKVANTRKTLAFTTHRLLSSSFLGLPDLIPNMNPKKELLWSLWVMTPLHLYLA